MQDVEGHKALLAAIVETAIHDALHAQKIHDRVDAFNWLQTSPLCFKILDLLLIDKQAFLQRMRQMKAEQPKLQHAG